MQILFINQNEKKGHGQSSEEDSSSFPTTTTNLPPISYLKGYNPFHNHHLHRHHRRTHSCSDDAHFVVYFLSFFPRLEQLLFPSAR